MTYIAHENTMSYGNKANLANQSDNMMIQQKIELLNERVIGQ